MTVDYECRVKLDEYEYLTAGDVENVKAALDGAYYTWHHDGDDFTIAGKCEVDENGTDAADVAAEIRDLLWEVAEIDADVKAEARYDEDVYREDTFDEERRWFYLGLA